MEWRKGGQLLLLAFFISVIYSCSDPTGIGSELVTGLDDINPNFTDTTTIETVTTSDDSLYSILQPTYLLGSMDDPVFGKSYAGIYFQPRLPANNVDIGDNLVLDSVVLRLATPKGYGDLSHDPAYSVYRLTEQFVPLVLYRNTQSFERDPDPVAYSQKVSVNPSDSGMINIRLNRSFGEELLNQSGTENLSSNVDFHQYLPGFYISPDTSAGYGKNAVSVDMVDSRSALYLYYSQGNEDSLFTIFPINSNSAISGFTHHQYSHPEIKSQLQGNPPSAGETFVQGMAGLSTRVDFPYLDNLGDVSVNKAELIINVLASEQDTMFKAPETIYPRFRTDTAGLTFSELEDQSFAEQFPFYEFGGERTGVTIDGESHYQYRLNVIRYIQNRLTGRLDVRPFYLKAFPAASSPGRAVLAGGDYPNDGLKMRLRLFYTRK